ncbi:MAG: NYN domain-containing protein [Acidimicrobiia bacterium]|nr:NYN domain-containing protein [Acidimicrobiia bacterium]
MSNFRGVWITVLDEVVTAGRSTLRDLDGPEIPASLQRVAAYSGGKLPPPLAASLLTEIDRNEWFRDKVTENWSGDPDSPAGWFLRRDDGWWVDVATAAGEAMGGRDESQLTDLQKQMEKLEGKRQAAAGKAADYKKALDESRQKAKDMVEAARRSVEAKFAAESAELAAARSEISLLEERLDQLEREHRELQDAFDGLRSRLAKARRYRLDPSPGGGTSRFAPSDPVKLARQLDLQTASYGRAPGEVAAPTPTDAAPLNLDAGVRPDSSDAIRWLTGLDEAVVVLVDGYNAQFHIDRADFTSGAARRHLVDALQRLRAASAEKHRVVVVFDSTLPGERMARSSVGGVEIRFAEKDRIADEEIVAMAGELERAVVISSDREVREGAEDGGAVVLWSEALKDWLARA